MAHTAELMLHRRLLVLGGDHIARRDSYVARDVFQFLRLSAVLTRLEAEHLFETEMPLLEIHSCFMCISSVSDSPIQ